MPIKKDNEAGFITSKRTKIPCHSVSWNGGKGRQAGKQAGRQAGRQAGKYGGAVTQLPTPDPVE